jgi:hypothetical protein
MPISFGGCIQADERRNRRHVTLTVAVLVLVSKPTNLTTAGGGIIVVESVAAALPDSPPDTLTWFTCGELALDATFTVTVMSVSYSSVGWTVAIEA